MHKQHLSHTSATAECWLVSWNTNIIFLQSTEHEQSERIFHPVQHWSNLFLLCYGEVDVIPIDRKTDNTIPQSFVATVTHQQSCSSRSNMLNGKQTLGGFSSSSSALEGGGGGGFPERKGDVLPISCQAQHDSDATNTP